MPETCIHCGREIVYRAADIDRDDLKSPNLTHGEMAWFDLDEDFPNEQGYCPPSRGRRVADRHEPGRDLPPSLDRKDLERWLDA